MNKRRLLRRPSPAMLVACLALAVALSGVGYAAVAIPRNSVGTPQLKKNAVTSVKVKDRSLRAVDFARGQIPPGPPGPAGAAGPTGPPGPTAGGASTNGMTSPPDATPVNSFSPTTITTSTTTAILAQGFARAFEVRCSVVGPCTAIFGLYLNGEPIPNSAIALSAAAGATTTLTSPVVQGVATGVPPGTHTVRMGYDIVSGNYMMLGVGGGSQTSAIALGE